MATVVYQTYRFVDSVDGNTLTLKGSLYNGPFTLEEVDTTINGETLPGDPISINGYPGHELVGVTSDGYPVIAYFGGAWIVFDAPGLVQTFSTSTFFFCFAAGTAIATPVGEAVVESLAIGDPILTADGRIVPVKWIGRQTVSTLFRMAERVQPVRVRAGALGGGVPERDLTLTADHALLIEGLLINAGALVNGSSIDWVPVSELGERFTVYHVETEDHDIILAEGAPAETYIDYAGRQAFDNHAEYVALYGEERTLAEMPRPRITSARLLPPTLKARLGIGRAA